MMSLDVGVHKADDCTATAVLRLGGVYCVRRAWPRVHRSDRSDRSGRQLSIPAIAPKRHCQKSGRWGLPSHQ